MDYFILGVIGFVVGLSGAMLPGPLLVYTISRVLQEKSMSAIFIVLGHMFIEAVMIIFLLLGLKQIFETKIIYDMLSILGGGVLIFMGVRIILRTRQMKLSICKSVNFSSGLIMGGIFFTAFNPTFPVWWMSVGASLLSRALLFGLFGVVLLTLGHWLADLAWYSFVGFAVGRGKLWLNDRRYQLILKVLGIALAGLGLWFVYQVS